ncbi:MAG TPA: class II glutamine amidotransferase [Actinophytocola sp.]|uniref:class II glutamine amidotransferase n=1 Tax=Actinophytocola sp. TaxID=1872138 RepID=UPI002DBE91B1|nr:class II glutamine amidotransferase [Actinophytocola sp.]HEU5473648.1 class II glutamine amidotransferase [Actinophytocola sp.]
MGSPVRLEDLLYKPENSLVVQSRHSRLGVESLNGDGFGVGWYGERETPGVFHSVKPAWNDRNLRELSAFAKSGLFFAHIRASTGTAVQETNCHPFRHGRWLWMHNGAIADFPKVRRELSFAIDPALYPDISGSTDSEILFYLALTFGLAKDPLSAVAQAVGLVEKTGRQCGTTHPVQMTVATTDGETLWAFRYSSEGRSRSLFHNTDISTLRHQHPDNPQLHDLSEDTLLVVSEPLGNLHGAWAEIPESTCIVAKDGRTEPHPFAPA